MEAQFEWDENKASVNLRKHGVIDWFKRESSGECGYQTMINRALRLYIRRAENLRREEAAKIETKDAAE